MKKIIIFLVLASSWNISYSWFTGVGNIKFVEKTIEKGKNEGKIPSNFNNSGTYIRPFANRTAQFGLESILDQKLTSRISQYNFAVVVEKAARYIVEGVITNYSLIHMTDIENNVLGMYKLSITVSLTYIDSTSKTNIWEKTNIQDSYLFYATSSTFDAIVENARRIVLFTLSERIYTQIVTGAPNLYLYLHASGGIAGVNQRFYLYENGSVFAFGDLSQTVSITKNDFDIIVGTVAFNNFFSKSEDYLELGSDIIYYTLIVDDPTQGLKFMQWPKGSDCQECDGLYAIKDQVVDIMKQVFNYNFIF